MCWKMSPSLRLLLLFMLLLSCTSSIPNGRNNLQDGAIRGATCTGCVITVSLIEQLSQLHNSTVKEALERLCNYLPEKLDLRGICFLVFEIYGPSIIKLLENKMNGDVVCHSIKLCEQKAGQPLCHLYHASEEELSAAIKKSKRMASAETTKSKDALLDICSLPLLKKLCEKIKFFLKGHIPFTDYDGDKFSIFSTLRGYDWRGRDCDDRDASVYPGRSPDNWDVHDDSNCNGIWGVDPKDHIPYEQKFCNDTEPKGIILLGDSVGADFHIPPEWITPSQMSVKAFLNLPEAFSNELDWPQFSSVTGFLNSTIGGWTDSFYLRLQRRNRCNHRDYQNIAKNGGSSGNIKDLIKSLARNQQIDKPAILIYELIGNDVCNSYLDTVAHMTLPEQMRSNVIETLHYLDSLLPKGSHVIFIGFVDGRFLWNHMHDRYHPIGQLNKDVTYEHMYSFLGCLQLSPCYGWMSSNGTLRNLTTERASQLSSVLKEIVKSENYTNFDMIYMDFPLEEIIKEWHKLGGEDWQLIEAVDGFHPNQIASALNARVIWETIFHEHPHVLGKVNPFNDAIEVLFKDQGGH